jgi:hypothetical protein
MRLFYVSDVSNAALSRRSRQAVDNITINAINTFVPGDLPRILTVRLNLTEKDVSYGDNGQIQVLSGKEIHLVLYGINLKSSSKVS